MYFPRQTIIAVRVAIQATLPFNLHAVTQLYGIVRMNLHSTEETAKDGKPSVLAMFETLLAVGFSLWLGCTYGTWWHVFVSCAIAPLMLLRTDASCRLGIACYFRSAKLLERMFNALIPLMRPMSYLPRSIQLVTALPVLVAAPIFVCVYMLLAVLASRAFATVRYFFTDFAGQIAAIPTNFWRLTIATDIYTSPELMPIPSKLDVHEENYCNFEAYRFPWLLRQGLFEKIRERGLIINCLLRPLGYLLVTTTVMVCFAYRMSVKTSAVVWLPLLWVLSPIKTGTHSWETELRVYWDKKIPQIVALLSLFNLIALFCKYAIWVLRVEIASAGTTIRDLATFCNVTFTPGILEWVTAIIRPGAIPSWHIAVAINSILGLFFCWRVWSWLIEYNHGIGPTDITVKRTIVAAFCSRRVLTSYTIIWNLFIIYNVAKLIPVPEIGWRLFPWV